MLDSSEESSVGSVKAGETGIGLGCRKNRGCWDVGRDRERQQKDPANIQMREPPRADNRGIQDEQRRGQSIPGSWRYKLLQ